MIFFKLCHLHSSITRHPLTGSPPFRLLKLANRLKLALLIIIVNGFTVSAKLNAQPITLNLKDAPLETAFNEIKKQTGYGFWYDKAELDDNFKISFQIKGGTLKETLDRCFKDLPFTYEIFDKTIVVKRKAKNLPERVMDYINDHIIKGKVTDEKGLPLHGVTIKIKSTEKIAVTNNDGEFSIEVPNENTILQFSYLGFSQLEQKIKPNEVLNIKLKEQAANLEEVAVVSTGYQTLPKERATGSFTVIDNKLYNEQVGSNVLSRLENIANGVSVFRNNATRTSQIMVRGISTITGPSSPLIIVDNFPYEGDINNLNPNDVESVTVLKDAAAASVWGTKAGNGVIVITTKKGKFNQPVKIEINSNVTISAKPDLSYLTPMASSDYIDFETLLYGKGYYNNQISSTNFPVLSPVIQTLIKATNGTITQAQADQQINALRNLDAREDYSKYFYQQSINQQYNINLRGGSDRLAYLFASGYDDNNSTLNEKSDRLNLRSEASFKILKNLSVTAALNYTIGNNKNGKPGYGTISQQLPYQMLADKEGNPLVAIQSYSQSFKDNAALTGQLLNWNYYPLTDYEHTAISANLKDLRANFSAQYQIIPGLNFDLKYQYESQQTIGKTLYDDQSYFARNLTNSYTQISGKTVNYILPKGGILDQQNSTLSSNNLRGQLNFDRTWKKHNLTILVGEEISSLKNESNRFRTYGYNDNILTSTGVDYRTLYPNYVTKVTSRIPYINTFSGTLNRFISFYTNSAYIYDEKYIISGSLRRDASNLFGVSTNDKWTPLWSAGLSWILSKENFFSIDGISYLKFRATYGSSGNVDQGKSAVTTITYNSVNSPYTNTPYSSVSNFRNPDLRWEKIRNINFGLDFSSKNNRISGSLEYYIKDATDLYGTVPVDYTAGIGVATITKNVAAMKGKGVDIELNTVNIDQQVRWTSSLNFNFYRDKVVTYYLVSSDGVNYVNDTKNPIEGHPVWSLYSYKWAGLDAAGNPRGYLNGIVSQDFASITGTGTQVNDLIYNGPRFPVFYGAMGNTVSYKNISITARISYNFGNYFRRQSINYSNLAGSGTGNVDYALRWQKIGDEQNTNIPSMIYPLVAARDNFYNGSDVLIEKADCIRLQYISLNYSITKQNYKWLPFASVQLYINANNLGILWRANRMGIDPDYTYTNTVIPNPKSVSFGLRTSF